jgi:hypothetical protein
LSQQGKFGTNGAVTSYLDNVIIYEIGTPQSELMAISTISKLAANWGGIKMGYQ